MPFTRRHRYLRTLAIAALAIAGVVVSVALGGEVLRKLRLLETAASDNIQWTLSQVEVEYLDLAIAIEQFQLGRTDDLDTVRREFDIFYSRIRTLSEGDLYAGLREQPAFARQLSVIRDFLDTSVPLIDGADDALARELPALFEDMLDTRTTVRELAATGLGYFAQQADLRREEIADTLFYLAILTIVVLTGLFAASVVLFRLNRSNEARARTIEAASRRMETIVNTSLDAIVVSNRTGRIIAFNDAAEIIFGYRREQVIGQLMSEIIVPPHLRKAHEAGMERFRTTGEKRVIGQGRIKLEAMRSDGSVFPAEMAIESAEGSDGEIFVGYLRDISHRVKAETDLVEARDKAVAGEKAKSEFLAVMSHEMRTPLNGLLGTLALLKGTKLSAKQAQYVDNLEVSGGLLLTHINDVLDVTKYEAGKLDVDFVPTDLSALVRSVVDNQRDLAAASENTIEWSWVGKPLPPVMTDPQRLRQILINLVGNAVKFTRGGRIRIEIGAVPQGGGADVTITVSDTGIGIAPEDIDRLFEDFETGDRSYGRARNGTGLGLGIARRLTRALGGTIGAESELGEGSTFWIDLPLDYASDPVETGTKAKLPARPAQAQSILVIEDNEINRTVLREMLIADGHRVVEAEDGLQGVHLAQSAAFDLILMDISMPVLDGVAATELIRSTPGPCQTARIVAVTAHVMPGEVSRFTEAGMNGVLSKPIDRARLRQLLVAQETTTEPTRPETGFVDPGRLAEFRSEIGDDLFAKLRQTFVDDGDALIAMLSAGGEGPAQVADRCHKMAGAAAIFGAGPLREALKTTESACREGVSEGRLADLIATLVPLWADTREAVLSDTGAPAAL
ncbi:ATP-binding protein [Maritimibacter alexandrii]|uniref:ATP-binding protein n=1 Tax=Maritimibacter alexandrii TaxID=2570355 RepID=UPI001108588E|nr:ATP-binding protein [Maritimibacter alexandrii]